MFTSLYITHREVSLVNKLLKKHGYQSSIRDLRLFDRYLMNIFTRIGVEKIDQEDIINLIVLHREVMAW